MKLRPAPISLKAANAAVANWHRHHKPVRGAKFSLSVKQGNLLVGVAICGRPVGRALDDGWTLEVTRVATSGVPNACSFLYGMARRVAQNMGYARLITYTLPSEGGASLRGAGRHQVAQTKGGSWDTPSRRRTDKAPTCPKWRWEIKLCDCVELGAGLVEPFIMEKTA